MFANLAYLAHSAYCALELGVILGAIECTLFEWRATVDGTVAGSANLEFGELVKFNLDCVVGVPLALSFSLFGLEIG